MNDSAETWIDRYRKAWSSNDPDDIRALFTEDATYKTSPFDEPWRGLDEIVAGWIERADTDDSWTFEHSILGRSGDLVFIQGNTDYRATNRPLYYNLWVVQLASDGRAREFTEWYMSPSEQS